MRRCEASVRRGKAHNFVPEWRNKFASCTWLVGFCLHFCSDTSQMDFTSCRTILGPIYNRKSLRFASLQTTCKALIRKPTGKRTLGLYSGVNLLFPIVIPAYITKNKWDKIRILCPWMTVYATLMGFSLWSKRGNGKQLNKMVGQQAVFRWLCSSVEIEVDR